MSVQIIQGDCREVLRTLPDASVHCVVTSPPYFGLRDYGTGAWEGGDPACDHGVTRWEGAKQTQGAQSGHARATDQLARTQCRCGAVKVDRQIGLEESPEAFVVALTAVFREVRRVLRDDGTLWLNMGDSYAGARGGAQGQGGAMADRSVAAQRCRQRNTTRIASDVKGKDLIGIPWMLAFALRADGWYLRQDIIWSKPNPMPESVKDRCTKAHEYLFLLSKSPRYYFDADAIAEPLGQASIARLSQPTLAEQAGSDRVPGKTNGTMKAVGRRAPGNVSHKQTAAYVAAGDLIGTRNKRSVWNVATQPFKEAHFATFPPALVDPCILAGCPEGGTVLDPFGGAGTTGLVANRLQRNAILIDLNPEYAGIAERRIVGDSSLFAQVEMRSAMA